MIPQIKDTDFPKICRLCMNERDFINILDRPDLMHTYATITNNSIKHNDCFPKNICLECVNKLESIIEFIDVCRQSHDYLTSVLLNQDDKEIIIVNIENEAENTSEETACANKKKTEDEDDVYIEEDDVYIEEDDVYVEEDDVYIKEEDNTSVVLEDFKMKTEIKTETIKSIGLKTSKSKECNKCKKIFKSEHTLQIHMKKVHKENKWQCGKSKECNKCKKIFKSEHTLQIHIKKVHKENKWQCFDCNKEFLKKNDLQRHLRIHTGTRPFLCIICGVKFTQKSTLNRHMGSVHILDAERKYTFECFICENKFNRKDHLEPHMINCHIKKINEQSIDNPEQKDCTECGKSFSLFSYMKQHIFFHQIKAGEDRKKLRIRCQEQYSSNLCSICGKTFQKRPAYLQHMRRTHGPPETKRLRKTKSSEKQTYQCWQCGKIKSTLCNLKVHMRIHTGEKPYKCKFCHRQFSAWNSWHDHENIHMNLKPYQCEHCAKLFTQRSSLSKHLKSSAHIHQNIQKNDGNHLLK